MWYGFLAAQISRPNIATTAATPSPTASAFNRQNQIPVNHYTGIPQIGIPIYTNNSGGGHSISLSYFAGGNRVEEMPGNTGLGWNLNTGGAITRVVQGLPDDMPNVGWIFTPSVSSDSVRFEWDPVINQLITITRDRGVLIHDNQLDGEWDIFQFNVNGLGGKFYIAKGGAQIAVAPQQKIKIIPNFNWSLNIAGSTIESFTIIDEQGTRYIFNERELTTLTNASGNSGLYGVQHISAWYLSQIVDYNNTETITFNYVNRSTNRTLQFPPVQINRTSGSHLPLAETINGTGTSSITGKRLASISFPDLSDVQFVYDAQPRCDFASENALREINIRYNNSFVKGFKLDYMYFTRTGNASYGGVCSNTGNDHRLQLKSVTEYNASVHKTPTVFHYDDSRRLPALFSPAQDHWGFFNGAVSNSNLIPPSPFHSLPGANRNSDSSFTSAGILNAVQFPGGATTLLEYEQNKANTVQRTLISTPSITNFQTVSSLLMKIYPGTTRLKVFSSSPSIWGFAGGSMYSVSLRNVSNGNILLASFNMSVDDVKSQRIFDVSLPTGNYTLSISIQRYLGIEGPTPFTLNNLNGVPFVFQWENETTSTTDQLVGGLRVKRITDFDGVSSKPISQREFEYVKPNGTSSGFISLIPKYDYIRHYTETNGSSSSTSTFLTRNGTPVNNLHFTQGSPLGYERVIEYFGIKENNLGFSIYDFTSYNSQNITPDNSYFYPYLPNLTPDWVLGLPLKTEIFGAGGTLLSRSENTYNTFNEQLPNAINFEALKIGTSSENFWGGSPNHNYIRRLYYPISGRIELTRTRQTGFEKNDTIINTTEYVYDPNHFVPVQTIAASNKKAGEITEQFSYYPFHYTGINTGPIADMKQNELLLPIASESWLRRGTDRFLMDAEVNEIQKVNNKLLPYRVHKLQSTAPVSFATIGAFNANTLVRNTSFIVPQIEQTVFNSKDMPLEARDLLTNRYNAIILDHNNEVTVAKVQNAQQTEIAYSSFEADGKGNWNYSGTPVADPVRSVMGRRYYVLTAGAVTRSSLPTGKNYTLTLWSRSGTVNLTGGTLVRTETNSITGWTFNEYNVTGGTSLSITGTAHIDELRLYPTGAAMVTENYDLAIGLLSACDANSKIIYNDYDNENRIRFQRDQDYNIIKAYSYTEPSTGVNTTPNWQYENPAVTSCAKWPNTNYNTGELLQQQRDVNPNSPSFNSPRWVSSGINTTACPVVADWQQTTLECELNPYGAKTGNRISVQQDMNPASPTFNQIRRINLGFQVTCFPTTIYASIETRNLQSGSYKNGTGTWKTADLYVVLKDASGNPLNVPGLLVSVQETSNFNGSINTGISLVIVNGSEALVFSGLIEEILTGRGGSTYYFSMTVVPGTGYVAQ